MSCLATYCILPLVLSAQVTLCQRYAERIPIPMGTIPLYDEMDMDYETEGYDFTDDSDVYRWNVEDYPHPLQTPMYCHREKASYVCDPDLVIAKGQADDLDKLIKQLYEEMPCICDKCQSNNGGIRLGIALMKNMYQPYNEHPTKIVREFAEHLKTKWLLGDCDNDILIVIATADRLFYIEVGSRTSQYLSFETAYEIFEKNKGKFSKGHFYEGLKSMLENFRQNTRSISRNQESESEKHAKLSLIIGVVVGAVVLIAVVAAVVVLYVKKCKSPNDTKGIDEVDDNAEGNRSSWRRKDIKVLLGSFLPGEKTTAKDQYSPCNTDETKTQKCDLPFDDEVIDTTLQTCVDMNSSITASPETEVTSEEVDEQPEIKQDEENNVAEGEVFIKTPKMSTFGSPAEYRGPVTDF